MRLVHVLIASTLAILFTAAVARAQPTPGFHFVEVQGEHGAVKGTIYVPRGLDLSEPAPALVFLHGYGECGTDGSRNLGVGLPNALLWDADRWPFVIVMPQKPVFDTDWDTYDDAVITMLDLAIARFGADGDRVGITGLSQGGHGTIAIATNHPDRFRAAAPVCGYTKLRFTGDGQRVSFNDPTSPEQFAQAARAMSDMGVWIFHGGRDDVVPPSESKGLFSALEHTDNDDIKLTIFPEDNHNSWDSAYKRSGLWDWFGERLRDDN